jgi:uncharacterized protein (UPF0264 family)
MKLLVSVRSAAEAEAALAGGADLIDTKEPERGSLGFAGAETIAAVVSAVAGRRPVSAALGELAEGREAPAIGLAFAKWGLARCHGSPDWPVALSAAAQRLPPGCRPVAVAYADWRRARAPSPGEVCAFVCSRRWGALLIDTWRKDGTTLLDWSSHAQLLRLRKHCAADGVPIAFAGSLTVEPIALLRPLQPDWFAVRGAACRDGQRTQPIDAGRVRRLAELLAESITAATRAG